MDLSLRLIRALLAVVDEGSITRAAASLGVTQQAVSGQIRQLEGIAGASLLVRTPRGVELTAAGEVVAKRGAAMLAEAEAMLTDVQGAAAERSARLRVAFKAHSTAHFMPLVADAMRAVVPSVELDVVSVASLSEEVELLAAGAVDAAFVWLPAGDNRLATAEIRAEPRVVALAPDHPLAGRTAVHLCDLAADPVVGPHSSLPAEVMRWWVIDPRPGGAPARYGPEARTPEECLQLVAGHKGVWIAPASAATYFSRPRLAWLPVTDAPPFHLAVTWMRDNRPALLDGFVERCRELADAAL